MAILVPSPCRDRTAMTESVTHANTADSVWRIGPRGLLLVVLIVAAAILNYVDRQALSLLAPTLKLRLGMDDHGYALVANAFLAAYTLSFLGSGRLIDRIGPRAGIAACLGFWSLANVATGFVDGLGGLLLCRALLGIGEAGLWVAVPRLAVERFLPRTRGIVLGLSTMGATLGATIAPPLIISLAAGGELWAWAFLVTGLAGLALVPLWLWGCPSAAPPVTGGTTPAVPSARAAWRTILFRREMWLLVVVRLITDPVWYFYQFWFPTLLNREHGWSQERLAHTWFVYLPADAGCLAGGFLAAWAIARSGSPAHGRLRVMLGCCLLTPLSALVALGGSDALVLGAAMAVIGAHLAWLVNVSALAAELMPPGLTATVFGVIAAASAVGGLLMNSWVGSIATAGTFTPVLLVFACVHPLAWLLCAGLGRTWSHADPPGGTP